MFYCLRRRNLPRNLVEETLQFNLTIKYKSENYIREYDIMQTGYLKVISNYRITTH